VADEWEGVVVRKSRGLLDGSNMYRRVKIRLADGTTKKVRIPRELWNDLSEGDTLHQSSSGDLSKRVDR
jgi:hypothetical protein